MSIRMYILQIDVESLGHIKKPPCAKRTCKMIEQAGRKQYRSCAYVLIKASVLMQKKIYSGLKCKDIFVSIQLVAQIRSI